MSRHSLWSIEDAAGYCVIEGYILFLTEDFKRRYAIDTERKRMFELDSSIERNDDYDCVVWEYYVSSNNEIYDLDQFIRWLPPYRYNYSRLCRKHGLHPVEEDNPFYLLLKSNYE